jgi:rhodanese-related sulfurtransferase
MWLIYLSDCHTKLLKEDIILFFEMNITVSELKKKIDSKENFILLDIRLNFELQNGIIEGSIHIPMKILPDNLDKLDKSKEIIVYCHSGGRSAYAVDYLRRLGYNAKSLEGGMIEWENHKER